MKERIAITGIGLLSPAGVGRSLFWQALEEGCSGLRPASLFDATPYRNRLVGEVFEFDHRRLLGSTGLRHFDRTTLLLAAATKLALEDAGYQDQLKQNGQQTGMVVGSTFGSISSIISFDSESVEYGPRYVNPMAFPNTVLCAPAGRVSILFQARGVNATVATGETSGIDALIQACDFLVQGRAQLIVAGGCYGLSEDIFAAFSGAGVLAGSRDGAPEISAPFDRRRNGFILGEGSCLFCLERREDALRRKARIYAEISGFASTFTPHCDDDKIAGRRQAVERALQEASLEASDVSCVFAGANSTEDGDRMESEVLKSVFAGVTPAPPVTAVKSVTGECLDAGAALQTAAAIFSLRRNLIPPIVNYSQPDPQCDLDYVTGACRPVQANHVLVSAFSPVGHSSFLVISRSDSAGQGAE